MNIGDVVTRVRAAIDELMVNDSGFLTTSEDEKNLTAIIIDKLNYGLQWVYENAPAEMLDSASVSTLTSAEDASFGIDGEMVGRVTLPEDLLRIVEARLSSWAMSPEPVSSRSEVALMQQNVYARGTWDRPVSLLRYSGTDRLLELYSARSVNDTLELLFVRKPREVYTVTSSLSTSVTVPIRLESAFVYHVAGLTMLSFKDDVATSLLRLGAQYLGIRDKE